MSEPASYHTVLTIAGSDCSGGAGIQADIKTISSLDCYAASVITALTAQNTTGVSAIHSVPSDFVQDQLFAVFDDINVDVVKIGMLYSAEIIDVICDALRQWTPKFVVLDPVMVATSGANLIQTETIVHMCDSLFPLVDLITPNIPEAEYLSSDRIKNHNDMKKIGLKLCDQYQTNVLVKGGHFTEDAECLDMLFQPNQPKHHTFNAQRIHTNNTHGTGCTYSSAIAAYLAKDFELVDAIGAAKQFVTDAIAKGSLYHIGQGNGPLKNF